MTPITTRAKLEDLEHELTLARTRRDAAKRAYAACNTHALYVVYICSENRYQVALKAYTCAKRELHPT